ncbi:MAG TPA: hypothetical protein VFG64_07355 [Dongiaceae bacterium]|jgi:hypothetical protein|nr:hypothetical protein [Dongiaceae bacterium]
MTHGLAFLLSMLVEGAVGALLGACLRERFNLSRLGASVRAGAAAVIGTGATHPALWVGFPGLMAWTGTWRSAAAFCVAGLSLVETLFYAAALRGCWRWSLVLSTSANLLSFGIGMLLVSWLPKAP